MNTHISDSCYTGIVSVIKDTIDFSYVIVLVRAGYILDILCSPTKEETLQKAFLSIEENKEHWKDIKNFGEIKILSKKTKFLGKDLIEFIELG